MSNSQIKLIKILPHLIPLLIDSKKLIIYSDIYSSDLVKFLDSLEIIDFKDIKFTQLLKYFQKVETNNQFKAQSSSLVETNYFQRVESINQRLEYSIKGDTISLWPMGYDHPIRLEFFGEECERIYLFDENFGRKISDLTFLIIGYFFPKDKVEQKSVKINLPFNKDVIKIESKLKLIKYIFTNSLVNVNNLNNKTIIETDFQYPSLFYSKFKLLSNEIRNLVDNNYNILIRTNSIDDLPEEFFKYLNYKNDQKHNEISDESFDSFFENLININLPAGFISKNLKFALFTDRELYGSIYLSRPESIKNISGNIKKLLLQFEGSIKVKDYVVHEDYGVALYAGLKQEIINTSPLDYLLLKYAEEDELYVPINQIEKITKYIGNDNTPPRLTRLGKANWEHLKNKIKKSTIILARELIEHYAKREVSKAIPIKQSDSSKYKEFVNEFKFVETEDQLKSINEIISDLEKDKPMNRLLIGDVGFGKTEVFMRAILKVVENGGQAAVLSPTTILTAQHYLVIKERFKKFKYKIEYLSRFNTKQKNEEIIDKLNKGEINIVIGTHRLLSSDIKFKTLQLLVVDEEQRFGVKQKEKIKHINYGVHVLLVSATPIPRTLSMALSSIQEMSIISQPPKNRKPIKTEIIKNDWNKVSKAIEFEINIGGQIYFLHNEIQTINSIFNKLVKLTPGVRFIVAHGQMSSIELDKIMKDFYAKKFDCLISTTIIENGLDLPNVNTIIINKANRFGLSQLYQLRGRVGRSDKQSYCFLLYEGKDLKLSTKKKDTNSRYLERLQAMVDNQDLGAGFRIASKDLEFRGGGNILGSQQSGNISTLGYALYIEMLSQEVESLKRQFNM